MKKNKTNYQGFTLIELMLVIAIITLLTSIAMFNGTEARKKAQDSKMISESHQVETAIALYKENNNEFVPHDTRYLGKIYQEGGPDNNKYEASLKPLVDAKILPAIPKSPDGQSYAYGVSSNKKEALFIANLKTKSLKNATVGSGNNSCKIIKSYGVPPNCSLTDIYINTGGFVDWISNPPNPTCSTYLQSYPDKICVKPQYDFCNIYNQNGDFNNTLCNCASLNNLAVHQYCSATGALLSSRIVPGGTSRNAYVCDKPAENFFCDGSNSNEYCSCI